MGVYTIPMKNYSPWLENPADAKRYEALSGEQKADAVVIGGGIAGVMTAWNLAKSGQHVILLEKNHMATGDTGASTGFLTKVPDASIIELTELYGKDFVRKIFSATSGAQQDIFRLIEELSIECDFMRCSAYSSAYEKNDAALKGEFESLSAAGVDVSFVDSPNGGGFPFAQATQFKNEGKCNIRKFLFGLLEKAVPGSITVFEESEAVDVEITNIVKVKTAAGSVTAEKLFLAVGRPMNLFPELAELSDFYITYVLAAEYDAVHLADDIFWDTLNPYFYYRKINPQTIILGGADIKAEKTHTQNPYEKLETFLHAHFPGAKIISNRWSGSIFHSSDGLPYIFAHPDYAHKVFASTAFGGNGLVFGALAGKLLADLSLGVKNEAAALFSPERTGAKITKTLQKTTSAAHSTKQFLAFAKIVEFEKRPFICKEIGGTKISVFKIDGQFFAINNTCTHAGGALSEGSLDGKIITCPLHGAQFDVETGTVVSPPALRPAQTYKTRVQGDVVEVEFAASVTAQKTDTIAVKNSSILRGHGRSLFSFAALAFAFWGIEFAAQFYKFSKGGLGSSFVRSFSFTGATLIGTALLSSIIFKFRPRLAQYWRIRRYLGVSGFVFIFFHILSVYHFIYGYDIRATYYSFNPLVNPIIFGSIAFPILLVMALTSTDWAVNKLTPKVWKFIHRFVYIAEASAIFHFLQMNTEARRTPPGYLLLLIMALTVAGQLYWFLKISWQRRFKSIATVYGLFIIIATVILAYYIF